MSRKRAPQFFGLAVAVMALSPAFGAEAIARKAGCAVCHFPDKKGIGPSYQDIAAKYQGDAKAPALLAERVRKGSSGVWGKIPMAPTPAETLGDADLNAVIGWILKR